MKKLVIVIALILMLSGCSNTTPNQSDGAEFNAVGIQLITYLSEEKYDKIVKNIEHSKEMKSVATSTFYEDIWISLIQQYGDFDSFEFTSNTKSDDYEIYSYDVRFITHSINLNVIFSSDVKLSGLNYQEKEELIKSDIGSHGGEVLTIGLEFPLDGELVVPNGKEKMPLVILVHGSGASDRDETIMNNRPFYDIAKELQKYGVATYRYDKRTYVHSSKIDINTFTIYDETIDDAVLAFNKLNADPRFSGNVYILGHSMGGHVLPRIAKLTENAKGYVFLAANYSSLTSLISYQVEYLSKVDGNYTDDEKASVKATRELIKQVESLKGTEEGVFIGAGSVYWKDLNDYKPGDVIAKLKQPLLFLQGEGDYQVRPQELDLWLDVLDMDQTTYYTFEGLSHLFTPAGNPPSPADYEGNHPFDVNVIKTLAEWIEGNE